ncbi:hypothetical protein DH2020_001621 [Rehmannia glutinosa]|uniref:C3H1-type domain-containing protein n=1 Tax=Rehmannia glutinosa TaxID=99300 RepID=A0ABR0XZW4_REHGL
MELYGDQQQVEWAQETGLEESMRRLNLWEREVYPERPGLADCAYYMRTGSCGYGAKCRYNHPRDRGSSLGEGQYPERVGEPPCQGEKECSYYLKTGQCKFGITCKFDHPQPDGTSVSASARPFYPTVQSFSSPSPEQYDSSTTSYRVARPPLLPGSYVAGAYGPMLLPGVVPVPNWNPYSGPVSPAPSPGAQPSAGAASVYGMSQLGSSAPAFAGAYSQLPSSAGPSGSITKEQKFPERPGQPDCKYYMRTGDCKYGSSCRYNHPPEWVVSKSNCALSPLGLPLRPACSFYLQKGHCKFGRTCKFDHPMPTVKYGPPSSYTEMPGSIMVPVPTRDPFSGSMDLMFSQTVSVSVNNIHFIGRSSTSSMNTGRIKDGEVHFSM